MLSAHPPSSQPPSVLSVLPHSNLLRPGLRHTHTHTHTVCSETVIHTHTDTTSFSHADVSYTYRKQCSHTTATLSTKVITDNTLFAVSNMYSHMGRFCFNWHSYETMFSCFFDPVSHIAPIAKTNTPNYPRF
jgi:hypothetical protein